ncbi:response regulator [Tundrisphaera lichenicola]|uniref:response regulator n=1 Tax=Tundrisphaera lichenicola TaxID=2029860 RepID=UPI003EB9B1E8
MPTALIVEDDPDQAEMAARLLRYRNFDSDIASTGTVGLSMARSLKPDVVLLDLMLPDTTGFDVCRDLRSDRETMLTPVVMLTALGDALNRRRGYRVGANAYVSKPYGAEELFEAIAEARAWRERMVEGRIRGEIHVQMNSEVAFLKEVNEFLMSVTLAIPFTHEQVLSLRQALLEMCQNAIEWGNRHRSEQLVDITYRIHSDRVEIVIRDQGQGFDKSKLAHAASADDPIAHMGVREKLGLREGGFGLLITNGMVDEMRHNETGNEVTLIKRFQPDGPDVR